MPLQYLSEEPAAVRQRRCPSAWSYGMSSASIQPLAALVAIAIAVIFGVMVSSVGRAAAEPARPPISIVALGDSLTAGLGLPADASFPAKLRRALTAKSFKVTVANAGVSGDTAEGGLARLDWSVPDGTDAVILELGANDMLRGLDPKLTRQSIDTIVHRLTDRGIVVLICGMRAAPNLGAEYEHAFNPIFGDVAEAYASRNVTFYPFFLDGVAGVPELNQNDGLHPNAAGVDVIVTHILPKVVDLIGRVHSP
jgi:acyl-CoA thioesterase-1